MVRAVLDGNVYVSGIMQPDGPPGKVLARFLRDTAFAVVLSPSIVKEILRVLTYPKVRKYIRGGKDPIAWFEDLALLTDMVVGDYELTGVCSDPDDDKYLAAAMEGQAGFVVTGDRGFLALKEHDGVRIVTPRNFLEMLGT